MNNLMKRFPCIFLFCSEYSQTSIVRTSLGPLTFVPDKGGSSHCVLIMMLGYEINGDNLGIFFFFFFFLIF